MERRRSVNWEFSWLFFFPWLVASPGELNEAHNVAKIPFLNSVRRNTTILLAVR